MGVLRSCSGLEAYRKLYVDQVAPWKVAKFLITDATFPRSINFCVRELDRAIHRISGLPNGRYQCELEQLSGRLQADLGYVAIDEIFKFGLHQYLDRIQLRLIAIASSLSEEYCDWQVPELAAEAA
jgi:uncharacterized alpha-E superfamily protein